MQSDYRVKKLVTEEGGDVIAICYDVLYGETFEKYIGIPNDFDAKENAANLLQDSNYEISDKIRAELEETFGITEFEDDQDFDSYQFYDFGDDDFEEDEDEEDFAVPTKYLKRESFNLREALNTIDLNTYNKYDLLNLYEACNLSEDEKRALANIVYDQEDANVIYDTLNKRYVSGEEIGMPERVKDGVIHEDIYSNDEESTMTLVANDVIKFPNVISFKATFDDGELKGHTWSFVKADANGEEFIRSIGGDPDDTPVAFLTVNGRDGGYFTSTKDFASGEYTPNPSTNLDESKIDDWDSTDSLGDDIDDKRIGYAVTVWDNPNEYGKTVGVFDNIEEAKEVADKEYPNAYRVIIRKEEARGRFSYGWSTRENGVWKDKHINESKSIKESDEETPYTKEEIERDLKSITHNFTDKEGELKCGFEEEKNFGVKILRQHYRIVEVSGDDRRDGTWYHISYAEPKNIEESKSINKESDIIKISPNSKMKEIEIEDKSEVGADGHPIDRLSNYSAGKLK